MWGSRLKRRTDSNPVKHGQIQNEISTKSYWHLKSCVRLGNSSKKEIVRGDTLFLAAQLCGLGWGWGADMEGSDPLFLPTASHLAWGDQQNRSHRGATEDHQSPWAKTSFTQRIINQPGAESESEAQTETAQRGLHQDINQSVCSEKRKQFTQAKQLKGHKISSRCRKCWTRPAFWSTLLLSGTSGGIYIQLGSIQKPSDKALMTLVTPCASPSATFTLGHGLLIAHSPSSFHTAAELAPV